MANVTCQPPVSARRGSALRWAFSNEREDGRRLLEACDDAVSPGAQPGPRIAFGADFNPEQWPPETAPTGLTTRVAAGGVAIVRTDPGETR